MALADGSRARFAHGGDRIAILESVFVCAHVQRRILCELFADDRFGLAAGAPQSDPGTDARASGDRGVGSICGARAALAGDRLVRRYTYGILGFDRTLGALSSFLRGGAPVSARGRTLAWTERHSARVGAVGGCFSLTFGSFSCDCLWHLCATQRGHHADPPGAIPCGILRVPADGDVACAAGNRLGAGRGGLRCYTSRWFLPGDFPRHLKKGPLKASYLHVRNCDYRWRAFGRDVRRAVG